MVSQPLLIDQHTGSAIYIETKIRRPSTGHRTCTMIIIYTTGPERGMHLIDAEAVLASVLFFISRYPTVKYGLDLRLDICLQIFCESLPPLDSLRHMRRGPGVVNRSGG